MRGDAINLSQVGEQSSAQHTKQGPKLESQPEHAGRLHQELAARAGRVELVVAGLPVTVKA